MADENPPSDRATLGRSPIFTPEVINDIHMKAELGRYRMRGFSIFKKLPSWDDLIFLPGTLTRFVIEGYREKCDTKTVLGAISAALVPVPICFWYWGDRIRAWSSATVSSHI